MLNINKSNCIEIKNKSLKFSGECNEGKEEDEFNSKKRWNINKDKLITTLMPTIINKLIESENENIIYNLVD